MFRGQPGPQFSVLVHWQIISTAWRGVTYGLVTLLLFFFSRRCCSSTITAPMLISAGAKMQWEHRGVEQCGSREGRKLRDLGERIWLHLCPIKQLSRSRGTPNIYLYLVASLHLSAYGFMTSKLFGGGGASRQNRWLITKADRDGRQTHTRARTWIDAATRLGDGEQRSRNLTHSLWQ